MNRKRVTISDVARKAGVSIATVSRVINETDYPVNDELRKIVTETAEAMNYTPNIFGKSLKSGKSSDIGVILPSMVNPFYSEVIAGIEQECRSAGYNPIFCNSGHKPEKERELIGLMQEKCVEGLLISTVDGESDTLERLLEENTDVVLLDQPVEKFDVDSVSYDFRRAGMLAAQYLVQKGHREIAFLSAPFDRFSRRAIFGGFRDALAVAGVCFGENDLFLSTEEDIAGKDGIDEFANGRKLAGIFLRSGCRATAVAAINDISAFGVIQEFSQEGVRVPEDVSVMGFDDISFSAMVNPPLTTVRQPSFEMGRLAARALVSLIRKKEQKPSRILLKPELIERESVRAMQKE